jgi:hypothetical protein
MGYVAQVFAVDVAQVKKSLGSKNQQLFDKSLNSDFFTLYANQLNDVDFSEIIHDLLFKYKQPNDRRKSIIELFRFKDASGLNRWHSSAYGYGMIVICDVLGKRFTEDDVFYSGDSWDSLVELFLNNNTSITLQRMWEPLNLFDIPKITDFPVISQYTKAEIKFLRSKVPELEFAVKEASLAENDHDLAILFDAFKKGIDTCSKLDTEWVSFLH